MSQLDFGRARGDSDFQRQVAARTTAALAHCFPSADVPAPTAAADAGDDTADRARCAAVTIRIRCGMRRGGPASFLTVSDQVFDELGLTAEQFQFLTGRWGNDPSPDPEIEVGVARCDEQMSPP